MTVNSDMIYRNWADANNPVRVVQVCRRTAIPARDTEALRAPGTTSVQGNILPGTTIWRRKRKRPD